jgi:hypothetical protein
VPDKETTFRTVNDVIDAYFHSFQEEEDQEPAKIEPRMAGERLARSIAEATKTKVQEAVPAQHVT